MHDLKERLLAFGAPLDLIKEAIAEITRLQKLVLELERKLDYARSQAAYHD
jgi:hypothetical protein